jgi:hypothetical protein
LKEVNNEKVIFGTLSDISDVYFSRLKTSQNLEYFEMLFDVLPVGAVIQNTKGEITHANTAACQILCLTLDDMKGRTSHDPGWKAIQTSGEPYLGEQHPAMLTLTDGIPRTNQIMGLAYDDFTVWIDINTQPLYQHGKMSGVIATFTDITQQFKNS